MDNVNNDYLPKYLGDERLTWNLFGGKTSQDANRDEDSSTPNNDAGELPMSAHKFLYGCEKGEKPKTENGE